MQRLYLLLSLCEIEYSALVYHNNDTQYSSSSARIRPVAALPPPYDDNTIEYYKAILLEEANKLYNDIVDQILCEVVNENVAKQFAETMPSSLPAPTVEKGGVNDDDKQD